MLEDLRIKNLALIEDQTLHFTKGMNVLTGETGAGKSLIIDSINLILGMRASTDLIRTGCNSAYVESVFRLPDDSPVWDVVKEMALLGDNAGELVLAREISRTDRNICRVNGIRVNLSQIKDIGDLLIDIHGQHEHQSLLDPNVQLRMLDEYGGEESLRLSQRVENLYQEYTRLLKRKSELESGVRQRAQRIDLLRFQINEIDEARLTPGEESELEGEENLLSNVEMLKEIYSRSYYRLYEGDADAASITDVLDNILSELNTASRFDKDAESVRSQFNEALIVIKELSREFRVLSDRCEVDPERLSYVKLRLNQINLLIRKYGSSVAEILNYRDKIGEELDGLSSSDNELQIIESTIDKTLKKLVGESISLSDLRKVNAKHLGGMVEANLRDLGMKDAEFKINVARRVTDDGISIERKHTSLSKRGIDHVDMLFSANTGEPMKSLNKIASGGEISRIMLAIKAVIADADRIPVIVFDEIDVGLGGLAGRNVALKMADIAASKQIICVTHLAQIASIADSHYEIKKFVDGKKTNTLINRLNEDEREAEIARMIDGDISDIALRHAKEMIQINRKNRSVSTH